MSEKEEEVKKKEPASAPPTEMEPPRVEEVEPPKAEEVPPEEAPPTVEIPPTPKPEEAPPPSKKEVEVVDITELIIKELTKYIEKLFEPPWARTSKLEHWDNLPEALKRKLEIRGRETEYLRLRRCPKCGNWTPEDYPFCFWCGASLM
jgi:hypothetical protein